MKRLNYLKGLTLFPDELRVYCALEKPDIETCLCDEIALLECSIQGYHCIQQDRHRRGGGVAMYISDTLESQVLLSGNNGLEFLLVSVYDASKPTQKLNVGVWYQPPHDREAIENLFESLHVRVFSTFVILGD